MKTIIAPSRREAEVRRGALGLGPQQCRTVSTADGIRGLVLRAEDVILVRQEALPPDLARALEISVAAGAWA